MLQAWAYTKLAEAYATHQANNLGRVVEQQSATFNTVSELCIVYFASEMRNR